MTPTLDDAVSTLSINAATKRAHCVIHERRNDRGIESRIELTSEDSGGDVEAAAHFALRETVDVLRQVVRELAPRARGLGAALCCEGIGGDDVKVEEKAGDKRRDQRRGGPETCLVHIR